MYNIFPHIMYYLPGPHNQIFANFEKLRALVKEMAEAHQASLDPSCPRDFIDCFLLKMQQVRMGFVVLCGALCRLPWQRRAKCRVVVTVTVQFEEGGRQRRVPLHKIFPAAAAVQRLSLPLATKAGETLGCLWRWGGRGAPPFSHLGFLSHTCLPHPREGKSNG